MAKYESLPITHIQPSASLPAQHLPELVHMEDPAASVMIDFTLTPPHTIHCKKTMDEAINEMKLTHAHLLLAIDDQGHFQGIISPENILGEKPIKIIQERRITRQMVTVNMLMVPVSDITALDIDAIESARVGHIVKTLLEHKKHYAIVIHQENNESQSIRGIFTASQITKQLHMDLDQAVIK